MTRNNRAIVLLSGGIDSSTSLAIAKAEGYEVYALSFNYNQRHEVELAFARQIARSMNVERHLVTAFDLREVGGSALTSDIEVPKEISPADIPVTYVPARNTIFLSFALAWAEVLEAENIFIGANAVDYSGYPDCRQEYLTAFENMANLATKASVEGKMKFRINAPLISMRKSEIIRRGIDLGLDYGLTWSCYDPEVTATAGRSERPSGAEKADLFSVDPVEVRAMFRPCGRCDSCRFREKGFIEAGLEDPGRR